MDQPVTRQDHDGSGASPAGNFATSSNQNPILQVLTWLLLTLTTLMLGFRLLTQFFIKSNGVSRLEELLILAAAMIGRPLTSLTDNQLRMGLKAAYAGELLFLFSLGFARLSACAFLHRMSPNLGHKRATQAMAGLILLWTVSAVFSAAFQCGARLPWGADTSCFDERAFLSYVGISSIVTDAILISAPIVVIIPLRLPLKTRVAAMTVFASRIRVRTIVTTALQLAFLPRLFDGDFTFRGFPYFVCTQFVQFTSISAACLTYFWPLLRSLQSGLMDAHNTNFTSQYSLSALSQGKSKMNKSSTEGTTTSRDRNRREYIEITTDYRVNVGGDIMEGRERGLDLNRDRYERVWHQGHTRE
ncbi:hypothetical protein C8A01DRAFT_51440 [Parachaetomium inaequale]|uniref:Rhodopsin domain-containing protein n=1 Tax=Parachaetomium inaequale TaxID=2588326 RepID=A0AAN6P4K8_9PEZI|nr:hypothetical protein C8A01DRAFT_51440 [Parachaetomium inaequale]